MTTDSKRRKMCNGTTLIICPNSFFVKLFLDKLSDIMEHHEVTDADFFEEKCPLQWLLLTKITVMTETAMNFTLI